MCIRVGSFIKNFFIPVLLAGIVSCCPNNSLIQEDLDKDIEAMAVKCFVEHIFPQKEGDKRRKTVFVDNRMLPLDEKWEGILGSIKDNCRFCLTHKNVEYKITHLPKIESSVHIELWDYKSQGYNGGDYINFSPLIKTNNPDLFCMYVEYNTSFGESANVFISLMVWEKNGQFRYLADLNTILIFQ